ncbi:MAG: hypothetical protein N2484_16655, partial [Clostridia bacterium]|nr:hypothetical protein [Clostridia bacterium]
MSKKSLMLLNGSPRKKGTSYRFAETLKKVAEEDGNAATILHIIDYYDGRESLDDLKKAIRKCDVIGLIAPLYADTLPSTVIWFMERLALELGKDIKGKGFFSVMQCGYPEIIFCKPAIETSSFFAEETEMNWLGGVAYGLGSLIDGTPIPELGRKGKKIAFALKLLLQDISQGNRISHRVQDLLVSRIPKLVYRPMAMYIN